MSRRHRPGKRSGSNDKKQPANSGPRPLHEVGVLQYTPVEHREEEFQPVTTAPHREKPEGNLATQLVAPTLLTRESDCSYGCGTDGNCGTDGSCGTGGCGVGSIVNQVKSEFEYTDTRRVIEVQFRGARREYVLVEDDDLPLRVHDLVIVQGERGVDAGSVSMTGTLVHAKRKAKRLSGEEIAVLVRKANADDRRRFDENHVAERQAIATCRERIEFFNLPMNLVDAEWQFDHHRITFFFTAEGRVDFRELVRDLASIFRARIELRQISSRDEAKRFGGVGVCGLELCCTTHLGRYGHITLEHARQQLLQPNPGKLSGQCGRLKCCLLYEIDTYIEGLKRFPALESIVRTEVGNGIVQKIDVLRETLTLYHPDAGKVEVLTLVELAALNERRTARSERPREERKDREEKPRENRGKDDGKNRRDERRGDRRGDRRNEKPQAEAPKESAGENEAPPQTPGEGQAPSEPAE